MAILLASDNFNRADGSLGANWTVDLGGIGIVSNQAKTTSGNFARARYTAGDQPPNAQRASARISASSTDIGQSRGGPAVRMEAARAGYHVLVHFANGAYDSSNGIALFRGAAAEETLLGRYTGAFTPGDLIEVQAVDDAITVFRNGTGIIGPVTDATYTSGRCGLVSVRTNHLNFLHWDDFAQYDEAALVVERWFAVPFEAHQPVVRRYARAPWEARRRIGHRLRLPYETHIALPVDRGFRLPLTTDAGVGRLFRVLGDSTGTTVIRRTAWLPVEHLATGARAFLAPAEWETGRFRRAFLVPADVGGGVGRPIRIEYEADGSLVPGHAFRLSADILRFVVRPMRIAWEAAGQEAALLDTWDVRTLIRESVVDSWTVVPSSLVVDLADEWDVLSLLGGDLVDVWRVLPGGVLTAFSDDIQLPVGTVEQEP